MDIPDHSSDRSHPVIVFHRKTGAFFLGIHPHAPEFQYIKNLSVLSKSGLAVKNRAPVIGFHENGDHQHKG